MSKQKLKIWRMSDDAVLPVRMTKGSVGYDLVSTKNYTFDDGDFYIVETDIVVEPPKNYYVQVFLRSSLTKRGLMLPNGSGIIDIDYKSNEDRICVPIAKAHKGKIGTIEARGYSVSTTLSKQVQIQKGERIAQLVIRKTYLFDVEDMTGEKNNNPVRGGLGATNVKK